MQIFNLDSMDTFPYDERDKNIFFKASEFKTRVISLLPGENLPECEMASYVIFIVLEGEVEIKVNTDKANLAKNQCLITEPSLISMQTKNGVKIIGIQIVKNL
jgi:mannose-6-phosphate isomerase-like protein (cupin superfamily)